MSDYGSDEYSISDPWDDVSLWSAPELTRTGGKKPKVLIVGAGIGGLMLGNLLLKSGVNFEIFEYSKEVKPVGSAMSLGLTVSSLFQQLGILEEFQSLGKPFCNMDIFNENLAQSARLDLSYREALCGAKEYIMSRPELYDLLRRQIPPEKILMGKKVLWYIQDEDGVTIRTWDKQFYHGDILVGADGAYSAVRQSLFKELKAQNKLPACDDVPLPYSCVCLVGQTDVLSPEDFPDMQKPYSQSYSILGSSQPINFLDKESAKKNDSFRNSTWGPEAAEAMCKEVRHFRLPGGKDGKAITMGDLIDRTPKNSISKVMLEEKVFDTWYSGRTVLLGDACHKLNPSGGAGAVAAIHDAVALANWISTLKSTSVCDLETIFQEYRAERYPLAKDAFELSQKFRNIGGKVYSLVCRKDVKKEFRKHCHLTRLCFMKTHV
ncbi:hypothetical protein BG003_007305 [Podila horticola]|nr:hypothetical protein BG003_007305 [Podila horticola]